MTIATRFAAPALAGLVTLVAGCALVEAGARAAGLSEQESKALGHASDAGINKLTPIGLEEELEYGGAIAVMIVDAYGGLDRNETLTEYVALVGNALALHSDRSGLRYHFGVLDSDDIQAMAAPGGYVFITRGLIRELRDEAELAGVLAHEIAHVTHFHTLDIIQNLKAEQAAGKAVDTWSQTKVFGGILDDYLQEYLANGLPKKVELESDQVGAIYAARTGYDPTALKAALERIEAAMHHHHGDEAFGKTHPSFEDRYAELAEELARLPSEGARNPERFLARTAMIR